MSETDPVQLALVGELAQRTLSWDEAGRFDAVIAARIDQAVRTADFSCVPLPNFDRVTPDPHQVLSDLRDWRHAEGHAR